ncbi:PREDICTED: guanylate cyclase 32E-like [Priapulus caudatus]|uniref:guanylate cyclase n=1 Tax=Priapulus caudatus TaxID=37621 RepID=A0ABM1ESF7_PRICU|nr:PREDICTED: guanylate cyclase 32E-like [Priapulus caudatus]
MEQQRAVSNKELFPTFARTRPGEIQISKSVASVLRTFGWHKVVLLHTDVPRLKDVANTVAKVLEENDIQVTAQLSWEGTYYHIYFENPFVKLVDDTYIDTRIYVVVGDPHEYAGIMEYMQQKGLFARGEYFVVGVILEQYDMQAPEKYVKGVFQGKATPVLQEAYRSFLGIAIAPPIYPLYETFRKQVNQYLEMTPFYFHNTLYSIGRLKMPVMKIAGYSITIIIAAMTGAGAMGYMVHMDHNGDAEGNYTLIARKSLPNGTEAYGLMPVGNFQLNADNASTLPDLKLHSNDSIEWISGHWPIDEPECGFRNEKCPVEKSWLPEILGSLGGALLIFVIILGFVYRNWRYEQELASLIWKVDYKDIAMVTDFTSTLLSNNTGNTMTRMSLNMRSSQMSLISCQDQEGNELMRTTQVFTPIGTYKGTVVALKAIEKRHLDVTRSIRKELKMIRDIRHDNINPFVGTCIDGPKILILSEYCSKGSLQDILENEEIGLDNMFIASLVADIIRGMIYLHNSPLRSHGNLKSTNCVVDSRWVLKITDYGLFEFKAGAEPVHEGDRLFQNMLWTAPELLRDHSRPLCGTQKGDVYSFAVILYEVYARVGPWGEIALTCEEIVRQVENPRAGQQVLRPSIKQIYNVVPDCVHDCMLECWAEDPLVRPDFKTIRSKLKPMQKGMKPNIFDNMIAMMEKYATNLESLVEERTDQLVEEKKKTEALLLQMLPSDAGLNFRDHDNSWDVNRLVLCCSGCVDRYHHDSNVSVKTVCETHRASPRLHLSIAMKIHCSPQCAELLLELGGYLTQLRGVLNIKGKGEMKTYWVIGEDLSIRERRQEPFRPQGVEMSTASIISSSSSRLSPRAHAVRFSDAGAPTLPNGELRTSTTSLKSSPSCSTLRTGAGTPPAAADKHKRHSLPTSRSLLPPIKSMQGVYSHLAGSPVRVKVKQIGVKFVTTRLKISNAGADGATFVEELSHGQPTVDELCHKEGDGESVV